MDAVLAAILLFFAAAFLGGLALLAQWGRKNQAAEISLLVILFFVSLLVVGIGALAAYATYSGVIGATSTDDPLLTAAALVPVLAGIAGLALCVPPLRRVMSRRRVSGGESGDAVATREETGGRLADPPIFYALWLAVMVLVYNVVNLLSFSELVESGAFSDATVTPALVIVSEAPFIIVAVCGVGFLVRRNFRETLERLGYGPVTLRQLALVPPFVAVALGFAFASDAVFAQLQPGLYEEVGEISEGLFSAEGMSLLSAILFGLLIGIGAAAGEETLFRGAVQPALGILLTSLLFAIIHTQYGPSIILIHIFLLSVGLGLLRKYANTTLTFITHATYNFTLVLLSYFYGI